MRLHGAAGALVALLGIFLPGLLLVAGALPYWHALATRARAARMLAGVNAAAVGLLAAAFCVPVASSAIGAPLDGAVAAVAFGMLLARWPALAALAWCVLAALIRAFA